MAHISRWMDALPPGSSAGVLLFVELLVGVALIGWAYNRGFRPTDRGPLVRWPLLVVAFGLGLVVRHVHDSTWQAAIIAGAVILAGFFGRGGYGRGIGVPVMLLATLLGYDLVLSAIAFTLLTTIVLALSPAGKR